MGKIVIGSKNKAMWARALFVLLGMFLAIPMSAQLSVNSSNTPQQLVNLLTSSSCLVASNPSISSPQSVATFNSNGSSFPLSEGVLIRSGIAASTAGVYTGLGVSTQVNTMGDPDLQSISDNLGQNSNITDVAFLEFDFIPNGTEFSFDFLYASNEYGQWQCSFSDVFAFLLTDLTTGTTTNLAVVPGTSSPVTVSQVRDGTYNQSCASVNESFFSTYNVSNPSASTLNMRGHTVVMNASAPVEPNRSYRIRLVIGDYNDSDFDSAVFIAAGSLQSSIDLGDDVTTCGAEQITIDSNITDTVNYSFEWRRNGAQISGETNPSLTTNIAGTYDLFVTTLANNCVFTDQIVINELVLNTPDNLDQCNNATFFDLTVNDEVRLGVDPSRYEVIYYDSLANANADIPIPSNQWTNYLSVSGGTIYVRIRNRNNNQLCSVSTNFELSVVNVVAGTPNDFNVCASDAAVNIEDAVSVDILNGLPIAQYTLTYYTSLNDAQNNTNAISNPNNFPTPSVATRIWARLSSIQNTVCFDIVDFEIGINPAPPVDTLTNVTACDSYTLPAITNGSYFSQPNGQGTPLNAGDIITASSIIYIFSQDVNGCVNESSFAVTIIRDFSIDTEHCGSFIVPNTSLGSFYTQPNGPNGTGTILSAGTEITTNQRVYFYSEFNGGVCTDTPFDLEIFPLPPVDTSNNVVTCNSYVLPNLTNGSYFTGPDGSGTELMAGTALTSSQTIYIFNDDGRCTNEDSFLLLVVNPAVFTDVTVCGSYTLPNPRFGGYFTEPGGNGMPIPVGTMITETTTVYYYIDTTEGVNCTDNLSFEVNILPLPEVTMIDDVRTCANSTYQLPVLEFGSYYTQTNGQGTQLNAGDIIDSDQTIYIYNSNASCSNETSFTVTIAPLPPISTFVDITACEPYTLPPVQHGNYFSEPNGQGTQLNPGDIISTTQVVYIYNEDPILLGNCFSQTQFTVEVLGVMVDRLDDVETCDSYTLPELNVGNYFTEANGQGTPLFAGDVITSTQTIHVYAENGGRLFCFDNQPFTVTISNTPALQNFQNQESCGSYTLETLNIPDVDVVYYRQPGGVNMIDPSEYTLTQPGIYTIHVRLSNSNRPDCFVDEVFSVTVYPLRELVINDATICVDPESGLTTRSTLLESGLDPNQYTVEWYLDGTLMGTGVNYEATEIGVYTVQTTKLTPDIGDDCNYLPTQVEVRASSPEVSITLLTEPFESLANIRVDIVNPGPGIYEYRLNNGAFQQSNVFLNVPSGDHTVTVRDLSGICNDIIIPYRSLGYRSFFTPNGDGINDTWNIPDLSTLANSNIKIFDRFGRLVKEIDPGGAGWDGISNNGDPLPSTSYWFRVEYTFEGVTRTLISYIALQRN